MKKLLFIIALCGALSAHGQKHMGKPSIKTGGISIDACYSLQRRTPGADTLKPNPEAAQPYTLKAGPDGCSFAPTPKQGRPLVVSGPMAVYIGRDERLSSELLLMEYVLVRDVVRPIKWNISDERKVVNCHLCQKATAGDTVAWYSPAIAIPVGPVGCFGLPGLIVELSTPKLYCVLTSVQQSRLPIPVARPRGFPIYSREQYQRRKVEGGSLKLNKPRPGDVLPKHH